MSDKELLHKYTILSMQLQEEFLKHKQNFEYQKKLNNEFIALQKDILGRMGS